MRPALALVLATLGTVGCGPAAESFLIVTVDGRPAVHDAVRLRVTLSNDGTMRTDELALDVASFPVTFSISTPGRTGELGIQVEGVDDTGLLVGSGAATTTVEAASASVLLEPADFVVNTDLANDQYPSNDYESHGFQVAGTSDGIWTTTYRDTCATPCNMFARRFDASGRPVSTRAAAGTNGFPVSTTLTTGVATPAVAATTATTLVVWDFAEPSPSTVRGVACRALDPMGMPSTAQLAVGSDPSSDVASVTPLSNSNFAVTWNAFLTPDYFVRSVIVKPDCTTLTAPLNVSTVDAGLGVRRPAVAASGSPSTIMYAWILDGSVRVRTADNLNTFKSVDSEFLPATTTEDVEFVRVAPLGSGFAVVVRWVQATGVSGPGRIELYKTNASGAVLGAPVLVTNTSGSDFGSSEAFGVATRADGVLMVTWHSCLDNGDGNGCGVFARAFSSDGSPLGDEFVVPTTMTGDQTNPSVAGIDDAFVVVWRDDSGVAPDTSGSSVRARIVYP